MLVVAVRIGLSLMEYVALKVSPPKLQKHVVT